MTTENQSLDAIRGKIFALIDSYFQLKVEEENHGFFPLVVPSYDSKEVKDAVDSLLSTHVTMGKKCVQFEFDFAEYLGVNHGLFVNSGSSANLVALSILSSPAIPKPIKPGDEIITSALTWSTTIFPIYDIGAVPVFVDTDPETLTMNVNQISKAITEKTRAILPVHLLGNPCDMEAIMGIANDHELYVIEDCCEAHGAKIDNRMVGSFGQLSTFSFFFSHHISTIEGGMVLTDNSEYIEIGRSLRAHGWIRERFDRHMISEKYPDHDPRFLFVHRGYNLRPTEIQGAFGVQQLPKLEGFVDIRTQAAEYLIESLKRHEKYLVLPSILEGVRQSWFGFPIIVRESAPFTRRDLSSFLEDHRIETRPIMGGNFVEQPVMRFFSYVAIDSLSNSHFVFRNGIFLGLHHKLDIKGLNKITKVFDDFFGHLQKWDT